MRRARLFITNNHGEVRNIIQEYAAILYISHPADIRNPERSRLQNANMNDVLQAMEAYARSLVSEPQRSQPPVTIPPPPSRSRWRDSRTEFVFEVLLESLDRMYSRTRERRGGVDLRTVIDRLSKVFKAHLRNGRTDTTGQYFVQHRELIRTQLIAPFVQDVFVHMTPDTRRIEYNILSLLLPPGYINWEDTGETPSPSIAPLE